MEPRKGKRSSSSSPQLSDSLESNKITKKPKKIALYQKLLNDKETIWNFIPKLPPSYRKDSRFSNILDLKDTTIDIKTQKLVDSFDNVLLQQDENIYMVSEPPGEPYYIGRIVEFVAKSEFAAKIKVSSEFVTTFPSKFFNVRMNWYYRSRDIQEKIINPNPRLLYASLHQDICPIASYRGKCTVVHKDELLEVLPNMRESIVRSNVFYFETLFDRYTKLYYKVYSTDKLLHYLDVRSSFLYALNKRFRYVYVEEKYPLLDVLKRYVLENNPSDDSEYKWDRRCNICKEWTTKNDSLECDECGMTMHLYCMDPPLEKKLGKNVIWVCYTCLQRQENTEEALKEVTTDELEMKQYIMDCKKQTKLQADNLTQRNKIEFNKYNCWFQYLGQYVVSHLVDAIKENVFLPYPYKPSRYGQKYQWSHCLDPRPFKIIPYVDNSKKNQTDSDSDSSIDLQLNERGSDATVTLSWVIDKSRITNEEIDEYVQKCKDEIPPKINIIAENCNFLDFIVKALVDNNYNREAAFAFCKKVINKDILNEPTFTAEEIERFEHSVKEHGSELRPVWKDVGTQSMSMIVRLFYNWKKTERGRQIRGKHQKLKQLKIMKESLAKEQEKNKRNTTIVVDNDNEKTNNEAIPILANNTTEIEMKYMDDSSFDIDSLGFSNTSFHCLFCDVGFSAMWYKVTGGTDDENMRFRMQTGVNEKTELSDKPHTGKKTETQKLGALCIRCTRLWRRYAVKWSQPLEIVRRMYGTSVGSYNNAIETILEEDDINKITLSPEQAKNKYLEWENVQDAELIIRQRMEMIDNHKKLKTLINWSSALHTKQIKHVIRPYDKHEFVPERMQLDLDIYVDSKRPVEKVPVPRIPSKESISSTDSNKSQSIETLFVKNSESLSKKKNLKDNNENIHNDNNSNENKKLSNLNKINEANIETYFDTRNRQKLKMEIDKSYQSVKLDPRIIDELVDSSIDNSEMLLSKIISKSKKQNEQILDSTTLSPTDILVPLFTPNLSNDRMTSDILREYHKMVQQFKENNEQNARHISDNQNIAKINTIQKLVNSPKCADWERSFCCVCRENFNEDNNKEVVCFNCGVNVHSSCYGISINEEDENNDLTNLTWLCDPCSNELNPVISTQNECSLCYTKEKNHSDGKNGKSTACPDPLKPTINGGWCHVVCSLFDDNIKYCNAKNLGPSVNTIFTLSQNKNRVCSLCSLKGGTLVKVMGSDVLCHPICAQINDKYKLLFKKKLVPLTSDEKNPQIIVNQIDKTKFILHPVIVEINKKPLDDETVQFSDLSFKIGNKSLIELYAISNKQNQTSNVIYSRYLELKQTISSDTKEELLLKFDKFYAFSNESTFIKKKQTCKKCNQSGCVFWYSSSLCHLCHLSQLNENDKVIDLNSSEMTDEGLNIQSISSSFKEKLLEGINYNNSKLPSSQPQTN